MEDPRGPLERGVALVHALREIGGDKLAAALLLGIGRTTLDHKHKSTPAILQRQSLLACEELFNMEYFLICTNSKCRFIVNLREGVHVLERSKLVINECPECGHPWSSDCPFCGRPLEANGQGNLSRCLRCNRELRPDANENPTVR